MGAILLIGDKPLLLSSYTAVLGTLERTVVACNSSAIASELRRHRIDLVIVCFTVTDRARRSIISEAFGRSSRPQILQIVRPDESTHLAFGADAYISAVDPSGLVMRVRTMLGSHDIPHSLRPAHSLSHI